MTLKLDWLNIRREFEIEGQCFQVLAEKYNCSPVTLMDRARAEEWKKPRIGDIDAEAENEPPSEDQLIPEAPTPDVDKITPESALFRTKCIVARLLDELETTTAHIGQMQAWIKGETTGDRDLNRRRAMYQAVSMGNRAVMVKNLTSALKTMCEVQIVVDRELAADAREREKVERKKTEKKFEVPRIDIHSLVA